MSYLLSILDKSYIPDGGTAAQALRDSVALAQLAEALGYHRYWFAEHHATTQLASPAPEVLAAYVLAQTARIRVGTGGVMLRHYAPYKVAELFNLLATLAPDRVDLGVGKAPGGLPASTRALADGRLGTADFARQLTDLEGFLSNTLPAEHPHAAAIATPHPAQAPQRFCSVPARKAPPWLRNWVGSSSMPVTSMATTRISNGPSMRIGAPAACSRCWRWLRLPRKRPKRPRSMSVRCGCIAYSSVPGRASTCPIRKPLPNTRARWA